MEHSLDLQDLVLEVDQEVVEMVLLVVVVEQQGQLTLVAVVAEVVVQLLQEQVVQV